MNFYELADALDALAAYDHGAIDSGVHDPDLKQECALALRADPALATRIARYNYGKPPYSDEDINEFVAWCDDLMFG